MAKEIMGYTRYYDGSCLVKFEKDYQENHYVTEVKVSDGRIFLTTSKNNEEIERHELGIVNSIPVDVNVGCYGVKEENKNE